MTEAERRTAYFQILENIIENDCKFIFTPKMLEVLSYIPPEAIEEDEFDYLDDLSEEELEKLEKEPIRVIIPPEVYQGRTESQNLALNNVRQASSRSNGRKSF